MLGLVAQSCPTLCDPLDCSLPGSCVRGDSPGRNTGCQAFLQGIFLTQGSNPGLLRCRRILDCLSHQGSPRIRKRVACPCSRELPDPGTEPGSPALQAGSLPAQLPRKPQAKAGGDFGEGSEARQDTALSLFPGACSSSTCPRPENRLEGLGEKVRIRLLASLSSDDLHPTTIG